MLGLVILLVVIGTSIWVAVDTSRLGVKRGCLGGGFVDMGPVGWFFAVLLIWIIGFPIYLVTRPKYAALRSVEAPVSVAHTAVPVAPMQPVGPPPGWYPDPMAPGSHRWWDGYRWGPSSAPPASS